MTHGQVPAGRWLSLWRVLWVAAVVGILAIYALAVPLWSDDLHIPATPTADPATYNLTADEIAAFERRGLSLDFYAGAVVTAESVAVVLAVIVAGVIFWRRSDDWLALVVGLWLILIPTNAPVPPCRAAWCSWTSGLRRCSTQRLSSRIRG